MAKFIFYQILANRLGAGRVRLFSSESCMFSITSMILLKLKLLIYLRKVVLMVTFMKTGIKWKIEMVFLSNPIFMENISLDQEKVLLENSCLKRKQDIFLAVYFNY